MTHAPQKRIPATYMRGGTSKGVFFNLSDLPLACQKPGPQRDAMLLRVIGSPDPYAKQTDGMGGATSSTSKTVILCKSEQPEHDIDYLFGQVAIDKAFVDWSGNCGNLTAAVGAFAINANLVDSSRIPQDGICKVRVWQKNISKTIIVHVPISNFEVQETGDFELDGVTFPAAEVPVEFIAPVDPSEATFPTGNVTDMLDVPGIGSFEVSMISAGIPTIFMHAKDLGYTGSELQGDINGDPEALERFETIRAHGAIKMGLINELEQAKTRQHTPKIAFVAPPADYITSSGKNISAQQIDLQVRALSMGLLHHAMMGTAAVAIASAAAIDGTIVNKAAGQQVTNGVTFGHPSGILKVGAHATKIDNSWIINKVQMSRSARILMEGWVRIPC